MAVTTKKNHKSLRGRKNDGGAVKPVSGMDRNELADYINNKYASHIKEAQFIFSIYGDEGSIEYDYKEDARQKLIDYYTGLADYTEESLKNNTIYRMDGWELQRVEIDPETDEEIDVIDLEQIKGDNSYNFSYLGQVDLDWRVYKDEEYDKIFYVIHPHLGGDARGNYGEAIILEGDDEDEVFYRFYENFIGGNASIYFKFDDDSEVFFDSQENSDIFSFEVSDNTENEPDDLGAEFVEDFESISSSSYEQDQFVEETYDSWMTLNPSKIEKKNDGGGVSTSDDVEDSPRVYVQADGTSDGKWVIVNENYDGGDFIIDIEAWIDELNEEDDGSREGYTFTKWSGFGKEFFSKNMAESDFDSVIEGYEAYEDSDFPLSVIKEYMDDNGMTDYVNAISEMDDKYQGAYSSMKEMTEQMVDEGIYKPSASDMYVGDTDKRIIAVEDADSYVDGMDFDSALDYADMVSEYEERKTELQDELSVLEDRLSTLEDALDDSEGDDYDVVAESIGEVESEIEDKQEELDGLPDEMEDEVKEKAREKRADEVEERLENDLEGFLEEYGYENVTDVSFVRVDYDSVADDLRGDYNVVRDGSKDYIFSAYKTGGKVTELGKPKVFKFYVVEMTTKKIVSGHDTKPDAMENRIELLAKNPKLRFSVYPKITVESKHKLDTRSYSDWSDLKKVKDSSRVSVRKSKSRKKVSEHSTEAQKIRVELNDIKKNLRSSDDRIRKEAQEDLKTLSKQMTKLKAKHYQSTGSFSMGAQVGGGEDADDTLRKKKLDSDVSTAYDTASTGVRGGLNKGKEGAKKAGSWMKKQWQEADFGDGAGKAKFEGGGEVDMDVVKAIYDSNESEGQIQTSRGKKSLDGLHSMMGARDLDSETIAKSIFTMNSSNGKVSTGWGEKTLKGLTSMIQGAREDGGLNYSGGGGVNNPYSGNYYSSTSFVSENGLIDLAKKTFGNDWESGGDYDSDTEEIKMLLKQLDGEYVVFYVDPDERDEDGEKTIFEDAKSRYRDLINHTSNDGDIFVVLKKNLHKEDSELVDSYAGGGEIESASDLYDKHFEKYPYATEIIAHYIFGVNEDNDVYNLSIGKYGKPVDTEPYSGLMLEYEYSWNENLQELNERAKELFNSESMETGMFAKGGSTYAEGGEITLGEIWENGESIKEVMNQDDGVTITYKYKGKEYKIRNDNEGDFISINGGNWEDNQFDSNTTYNQYNSTYAEGGATQLDNGTIKDTRGRLTDKLKKAGAKAGSMAKSAYRTGKKAVKDEVHRQKKAVALGVLQETKGKINNWNDVDALNEAQDLVHNIYRGGGDVWISEAVNEMKKKGTVGAFTKQANRHSMTPVEFAKDVLANTDDFSKRTRQRAQFVKNANPDKF